MANQLAVIAATQGPDMSTVPKFFIDGALDSGAATNLYDGAGSGAPTPTPVSLKLGNRTDNLSRFNGEIYDVLVLKRALSAPEIADLSRNIWAVWQAPPRRLWIIGSETNNLTGTDSIQGNAVGAGNIDSGRKRSPPWDPHRRIWGVGVRSLRVSPSISLRQQLLVETAPEQQALPSVTSCR